MSALQRGLNHVQKRISVANTWSDLRMKQHIRIELAIDFDCENKIGLDGKIDLEQNIREALINYKNEYGLCPEQMDGDTTDIEVFVE
jgi:hypothetical protein